MKKQILFLLFITLSIVGFTQQAPQLSKDAEISIITIDPGASLYDTWGHSAIRVVDKQKGIDVAFNYGVYDFNTPNFYTKFMRGQLLYSLELTPFDRFMQIYVYENREIKAQVLQLSAQQTQAYFNFLMHNAKPENKKYLYDFFFDNCATKLRDVTTKVLGNKVNYNDELLKTNYTFRELIYQKLDNQPWGKFGIDIALGSVIDKNATPKQFTFLPSYAFDNFKNAVVKTNGKIIPLVKQTKILYKHKKQETVKKSIVTPMLVFSILSLFVLFITYTDYIKQKRNRFLDFGILLVTGLVGLLVGLLWFATDHTATATNFNVFWAFFPNLIIAFYVWKQITSKTKFLKNYYLLLLFLLLVTIIFWILKMQVFNWALIPILILLGVRYYYNYWYYKRKKI